MKKRVCRRGDNEKKQWLIEELRQHIIVRTKKVMRVFIKRNKIETWLDVECLIYQNGRG